MRHSVPLGNTGSFILLTYLSIAPKEYFNPDRISDSGGTLQFMVQKNFLFLRWLKQK